MNDGIYLIWKILVVGGGIVSFCCVGIVLEGDVDGRECVVGICGI